jgi:senataxin
VLGGRDREGLGDIEAGIGLDYTDQRRPFWQGIVSILQLLTPNVIRKNLVRAGPLDIVQFVAGHVGDSGDHLEAVLAAFRTLLTSLGPHFWAAGDDQYAETVLHSVLDSADFELAFVQLSSGTPDQPFLDWLPPFFTSIAHSPELFSKSLAIVASTFLDRFQKDRFDPIPRTIAISLALNIFTEVLLSQKSSDASPPRWPHAHEAIKVIDLHARFLAQLAFAVEYAKDPWHKASDHAVVFIGKLAARDSQALANNVYSLGKFGLQVQEDDKAKAKHKALIDAGKATQASAPVPLASPPLSVAFASVVWDQSYDLVRSTDVRGIGLLLRGLSSSSHLEKLSSRAWIKKPILEQLKAANEAMDTLRQPLLPLLMSLADERVELLLDFLGQPGIAEHVVVLLLSPIEMVHNVAQGLVKQAFDVTTRRECFRSLLFQFPDATFRGLTRAVSAFVYTSKLLPEAAGMAARVVRCLHNVIDVLCGGTDGLLRDAGFLARSEGGMQGKLVSLWKLMCDALAVLFRHTPGWSDFYENDQMTEWMRDAILLGVDLLYQFRSFEASASRKTTANVSPVKTSNIGLRMIDALFDPLDELIAWHRLTDVDLLASSMDLISGMLDRFARSGVALRPTTAAKIKRVIARDAASRAENQGRSLSKLRDDQLRILRASVEAGTDSDKERPSKASATKGSKKAIETIEIDDDDDDEKPRTKQSTLSNFSKFMAAPNKPSSSHRLDGVAVVKRPFGGVPMASSSAFAGRGQVLSTSKPAKGLNFSVPPMKNAPRPRGVPWTTYSTKPAVESSSDESSDDGGVKGLGGLAGLARTQKSPKIKQATERRSVKLLDQDLLPGRRSKGIALRPQETPNSARFRGVQDFSGLHRQILQWDCTWEGKLPPNMPRDPPAIPSSFSSADHYFAAFEPLLLVECWEQIKAARQEAANYPQPCPATIAGRQSVDDFTDVFLTIEHGKMPDKMYFGESDLVLLREGPHQTLAKIQSFARKREFFEVTLRCHLGNDVTDVGGALQPRTKWSIIKLYTSVLVSSSSSVDPH